MEKLNAHEARLSFYGGAGEVTGANFHIETNEGTFLIDCGMVQGGQENEAKNWDDFAYDPSSIDVLIITHSHQDHIGLVPKLVRHGFRGKIYSTQPTRDLSDIMLRDSMNIMQQDAEKLGRESLYELKDIQTSMGLWKGVPYHNVTEFLPGWTFEFKEAGHVLGSAMVHIKHENKSILFSGDLGNSPNVLLHDIEEVQDVDYVVMESVYGDRNHEEREERTHMLERAIEDVAHRKSVLMIPSFSLERTQELLYELNEFIENGRVPKIDVYLDSPLAIKVTEIYRNSTEFLNDTTRKLIHDGDDVFVFPQLYYTNTSDESKEINNARKPKVIIAGSGMMNGGRIIHHAMRYLPEKDNILLFVGYQAAGTLGRIIQGGAKKVNIYGNDVPVKAEVRNISGYSGHAGRDELVGFVEGFKDSVQHVFCAMGEPKSAMFLAQRLRDYLGVTATAPEEGDQVTLDFS